MFLQSCFDTLLVCDAQSDQFFIVLHQIGHTPHRTLPPDRWTIVFESALNATYGTSLLRMHESSERTFSHLRGYMADPALLFPALRFLLPQKAAVITPQGEIVSLGLHYTDELLALWPETPVIIRASMQTEATIWVYLDGGILCQARARELASFDGSYRSRRWRR